tara:strand:- start:18 stop:509 length:492 start_codon:yes stop_codon:yes gene_type:complete
MLDDVENLVDKAIAAQESSDFETAINLYRKILTDDPTQPDANHNFGALSAQLGLMDNALAFIENAINSNPHVYEYWVSLIDALIRLNRYDDATSAMEQAKSLGHNQSVFKDLSRAIKNRAKSSVKGLFSESDLLKTKEKLDILSAKADNIKVHHNSEAKAQKK